MIAFVAVGLDGSDVADSGQYSATNKRLKRPGRYLTLFCGMDVVMVCLCSWIILVLFYDAPKSTMEHRGHEAKQYGESNDFLRCIYIAATTM